MSEKDQLGPVASTAARVGQDQTTEEDGTESQPHLVRALSDDFGLSSQGSSDGVEQNGQTSTKAVPATMSMDEKPHELVGIDEDTSREGIASDSAEANTDHVVLTREIERRASEHLAMRAAAMASEHEADDAGSCTVGSSITVKGDLPASPPPPAPPEKDKMPAKLEPIQTEFDEKHPPAPNEENVQDVPEAPQGTTEATGSEIQTIIDQFQEGGMGVDEIMSPRLERQQPMLVLPPRSSSLEPQPSYTVTPISPQTTGQSITSPLSPQGTGNSISTAGIDRVKSDDQESIISGTAGSMYQPPPPSPDPEPALPFDFHRFLEQLRHRTADPVARFLRSFLNEFAKKQWAVHEQVKIISDFLEFISKKMAQCDVWRTVSDAEFDNAREGMEKLVMNRLYSQTFSPAIAPPMGSPRKSGRSGRSAADHANPHGPGRRGQHQEDVERDEVIEQKIKIYGWIREEHLDIKAMGDKGKKFLNLAQQELLKINTYRAPRDKVICVLNCCKVIFGYLRNAKADQSADAFVPLLIYTVLHAKPEHLVSNVQYIWRFRNQEKLGGEAGYYMSSLMGVVNFIENLDRTNLTIRDEEFERNVEQAVSAIAEKNRSEDNEERSLTASNSGPMQHLSEKSALSRAEVIPRNSSDAERSTPRRRPSERINEKVSQSLDEDEGDMDAVTGLLRSIQKPLSSIGRIFSDDSPSQQQSGMRPASTPLPGSTPRGLSPAPQLGRRPSTDRRPAADRQQSQRLAAEDAAARQASAETAQAQRVRAQEHKVVVETLQSMFPNLDQEVIEDVVRAQEGNVGKAVDACLSLSG